MSIEYTYPSQYPRLQDPWKQAAGPAPELKSSLTGNGQAQDAEGDSFFGTLLDIINPLQQLPIIGSIYRELTGDTISPVARLAGGFLFGGPIGFVASAVNAGIEADTGSDIGEHVLAMFGGGDDARQYAANAYAKTQKLS